MLTINHKQLYETIENNTKEWILIIYDILANHYVGILVYSKNSVNTIYIKSIDKYISPYLIKDYTKSNMTRPIYRKGKPLTITEKEYNELLIKCKESLIEY